MSLGDHDRGRGVSDSLTLGYKRAIRSTCWLVSEFEDEEEGLLPAAMLFFFASRDSLRHLGPQGNLGLQLLEGHPVIPFLCVFWKVPLEIIIEGLLYHLCFTKVRRTYVSFVAFFWLTARCLTNYCQVDVINAVMIR